MIQKLEQGTGTGFGKRLIQIARQNQVVITLLTGVVLIWAVYSPVISGYYLMEDDLWTYIDRGLPININSAFKSQAYFAGRPLGALWDHYLVSNIDHLSQMNFVRGVSIALICIICGLLYLIIKPVFNNKHVAFLVSLSAVMLPAFQSPAIKYFEMNSLVSAILSLISGLILTYGYVGLKQKQTYISFVISLSLIISALLTYQNSALLHYVALVAYVLTLLNLKELSVEHDTGRGNAISIGRCLALLCVPIVGMLIYAIVYKTFFLQHSSQYLGVDLANWQSRLVWFVQFPLQMGMDFFYLIRTDSYKVGFILNAHSYLFIAFTAAIFYGLFSSQVTRTTRYGISQKILLILFIGAATALSVGPALLSTVDGSAYRRLQAIQTILFLLFTYGLKQLFDRDILRRYFPLIITVLTLAIALRSYEVIRYKVKLVTAEFLYVSKALTECFTGRNLIHFIQNERFDTSKDFVGLMTNFKPWVPGVALVVLQDIPFTQKNLRKNISEWTLGTATDFVTSSSNAEYKDGHVAVPKESCLVDMTPLGSLVENSVVRFDNQFGRHPANADSRASDQSADISRNDIKYLKNYDSKSIVSSGDYAGFSKEMAFDGDYVTNRWASAYVGPEIFENAFIGVGFADDRTTADGFVIRQGGAIDAVYVSTSDDGQTWRVRDKVPLVPDSNSRLYMLHTRGITAKYWRIVAAGKLSYPAAWSVYELVFVQK